MSSRKAATNQPFGDPPRPSKGWAIGARAVVASVELINPATMDIRGEAASDGAAGALIGSVATRLRPLVSHTLRRKQFDHPGDGQKAEPRR